MTRLRRLLGGDGGDAEAGTIVIWLLGLCVMLLFIGGISLDLWRVLSERRALVGIADSASIAGATAIDEQAFRDLGLVVLDPELARARAVASMAAHAAGSVLTDVAADARPEEISVVIEGAVPLTLLRLLLPADESVVRLQVRAVAAPVRAVAAPVRD